MKVAAALLALLMTVAPGAARDETATAVLQRGVDAARAGRHGEAVASLTRALKQARAEGAAPALIGRVDGWLAITLEAIGDRRADAHYEASVAALEGDPDIVNFLALARRAIAYRMTSGQPERAGELVARMMARVERANVDEETRVEAVNAAVAFYKRVGRKDAERMALDGLADLRGQTPKIRSGRGKALLGRAGAAYRAGRVVEARAQILAARDDLQKAGDPLALVAWISLGRIEISAGAYRTALEAFAEAEKRLADLGDEAFDLWLEAASLRAGLLERTGRLGEAVTAGQALAAKSETVRGKSSVPAISTKLDLVRLLLAAGRRTEAQDLFKSIGPAIGDRASPLIAGSYYDKLAALRLDDGDLARAVEAADKSLAAYGESGEATSTLALAPARVKAKALAAGADRAAAERALQQAIEISERALSPGHPETASDLGAYAGFLDNVGRHAEAEAAQRRVLAIHADVYGAQSAQFASALFNLANTLTSLDRGEEAIEALQRVATLLDGVEGRDGDHVMALLQLAAAQRSHGRADDALRSVERAEAARQRLGLTDSREIEQALGVVAATALNDLGRDEEAWLRAVPLLAAEGESAALSQRNFGVFVVFAARIASRRGEVGEALRLARRASDVVRKAGGSERRFYDEWASDLACYAWDASH